MSNKFWNPVKEQLVRAQNRTIAIMAFVIYFLPILEGVLVEAWSSSPDGSGWTPGLCLAVIAVIHVYLGILLILEEVKSSPQRILAEAYDVADRGERVNRELERREIAYKLVREAFERLSAQTCRIEYDPEAEAWCRGGFHSNLLPVLQPFIDHVDVAFGVKRFHFSLEAYFRKGRIPLIGNEEVGKNELTQHFFFSPHVDRCVGVRLDASRSPASQCMRARNEFQQHIDNNPEIFCEAGRPRDDVYFRRYAACPISEPCSPDQIGALVLTSMQDDPFANDVLDVLKFISTLVSKYLGDYDRCFFTRIDRE